MTKDACNINLAFTNTPTNKIDYSGVELTLYPSSDTMPTNHLNSGISIGNAIVPLDSNGGTTGSPRNVVILGIGMSNTNSEFDVLLSDYFDQGLVRGATKFVNGAIGGWDACRQAIEDPDTYWSNTQNQVINAGYTASQVQVGLIKVSNNRPQNSDGSPKGSNQCFSSEQDKSFPSHAAITQSHIHTILKIYSQFH